MYSAFCQNANRLGIWEKRKLLLGVQDSGYEADFPAFRGLAGEHRRRHVETRGHDGIFAEAFLKF